MDEQQLQLFIAYSTVIEQLLACSPGEVWQIVNENSERLNGEFLVLCQIYALSLEQEGNKRGARFLRQVVQEIRKAADRRVNRSQTYTTEQEYQEFSREVLRAIVKSHGDPKVVYPLLQQNLDKLDLTLAQILQIWGYQMLEKVEPKKKKTVAAAIRKLGTLIQQFPFGSRADNLEIGIVCYEIASTVLTQETNPPMWAGLQNNLGVAYRKRIWGERAQNLEEAIAAFQRALQVYTHEAFPQQWATVQNNLAKSKEEKSKNPNPVPHGLECLSSQ